MPPPAVAVSAHGLLPADDTAPRVVARVVSDSTAPRDASTFSTVMVPGPTPSSVARVPEQRIDNGVPADVNTAVTSTHSMDVHMAASNVADAHLSASGAVHSRSATSGDSYTTKLLGAGEDDPSLHQVTASDMRAADADTTIRPAAGAPLRAPTAGSSYRSSLTPRQLVAAAASANALANAPPAPHGAAGAGASAKPTAHAVGTSRSARPAAPAVPPAAQPLAKPRRVVPPHFGAGGGPRNAIQTVPPPRHVVIKPSMAPDHDVVELGGGDDAATEPPRAAARTVHDTSPWGAGDSFTADHHFGFTPGPSAAALAPPGLPDVTSELHRHLKDVTEVMAENTRKLADAEPNRSREHELQSRVVELERALHSMSQHAAGRLAPNPAPSAAHSAQAPSPTTAAGDADAQSMSSVASGSNGSSASASGSGAFLPTVEQPTPARAIAQPQVVPHGRTPSGTQTLQAVYEAAHYKLRFAGLDTDAHDAAARAMTEATVQDEHAAIQATGLASPTTAPAPPALSSTVADADTVHKTQPQNLAPEPKALQPSPTPSDSGVLLHAPAAARPATTSHVSFPTGPTARTATSRANFLG